MGGRGGVYWVLFVYLKGLLLCASSFSKRNSSLKTKNRYCASLSCCSFSTSHLKWEFWIMQFIKSTFSARFCFMCICSFVSLLTFPWLRNHSFWYSWRIWILKSDQQKILWIWEAANQCWKIKHVLHWYRQIHSRSF